MHGYLAWHKGVECQANFFPLFWPAWNKPQPLYGTNDLERANFRSGKPDPTCAQKPQPPSPERLHSMPGAWQGANHLRGEMPQNTSTANATRHRRSPYHQSLFPMHSGNHSWRQNLHTRPMRLPQHPRIASSPSSALPHRPKTLTSPLAQKQTARPVHSSSTRNCRTVLQGYRDLR